MRPLISSVPFKLTVYVGYDDVLDVWTITSEAFPDVSRKGILHYNPMFGVNSLVTYVVHRRDESVFNRDVMNCLHFLRQELERVTVNLVVANLKYISLKKTEMVAKYWLMLALMSSILTSDEITISWAWKEAL